VNVFARRFAEGLGTLRDAIREAQAAASRLPDAAESGRARIRLRAIQSAVDGLADVAGEPLIYLDACLAKAAAGQGKLFE
jgi:hypothetical protein